MTDKNTSSWTKSKNSSLDEDIMFIHKDVLKRGREAFKLFNELYQSQPSCKEYMQKQDNQYHDCLVEKMNYCHEQVKQKFDYIIK